MRESCLDSPSTVVSVLDDDKATWNAPSPTLSTRIEVPRLPAYAVARTRLIQRLRGDDWRVCVVAAGPGTGKTTFAAQWLAAIDGAWLSLDVDVDQCERFWLYVISRAAARSARRLRCDRTPCDAWRHRFRVVRHATPRRCGRTPAFRSTGARRPPRPSRTGDHRVLDRSHRGSSAAVANPDHEPFRPGSAARQMARALVDCRHPSARPSSSIPMRRRNFSRRSANTD